MAKRLKLKFTIPSFQLCRSRNLSDFPGNPVVPAVYRLSPVNPKALDMGYPSLSSTPDEHRVQWDCKVSSNIVSVGNGCRRLRVRKQHGRFNYSTDSADDGVYCESTFCKMRRDGNNVKVRGRRSTTSVSSSISKLNDEEESESLISCLTSFSDEFYRETVQSPEKVTQKPEIETSRHRKKISNVKKVQRLRFQASQNRSISETGETTKKTVMSMGSTTRGTVEGRVKESFAVVKKSKDPHEDFKKSMLEMIMEMEMFEAKELEQLLHCFLALNSRHYHGVIVRAFTEIWLELFGETASVDQKSPARL